MTQPSMHERAMKLLGDIKIFTDDEPVPEGRVLDLLELQQVLAFFSTYGAVPDLPTLRDQLAMNYQATHVYDEETLALLIGEPSPRMLDKTQRPTAEHNVRQLRWYHRAMAKLAYIHADAMIEARRKA